MKGRRKSQGIDCDRIRPSTQMMSDEAEEEESNLSVSTSAARHLAKYSNLLYLWRDAYGFDPVHVNTCGHTILNIPVQSVDRIEWALRTAWTTLLCVIFVLFVEDMLAIPTAGSFLAQVISVVGTFNTLGPSLQVVCQACVGAFIAAICALITNSIFNGNEIGSGFAIFLISFGFGVFDLHPLNKKLGLALALISILTEVQNPELPSSNGFRLLLTVIIGATITIFGVSFPRTRTTGNLIAARLRDLSTALSGIAEIQLQYMLKGSKQSHHYYQSPATSSNNPEKHKKHYQKEGITRIESFEKQHMLIGAMHRTRDNRQQQQQQQQQIGGGGGGGGENQHQVGSGNKGTITTTTTGSDSGMVSKDKRRRRRRRRKNTDGDGANDEDRLNRKVVVVASFEHPNNIHDDDDVKKKEKKNKITINNQAKEIGDSKMRFGEDEEEEEGGDIPKQDDNVDINGNSSLNKSFQNNLVCKQVLLVQADMLLRAVGTMIEEIAGHFNHYTWEPRYYNTWMKLKSQFKMLKSVYPVLDHSVRLSSGIIARRLNRSQGVLPIFCETLHPFLIRLAREFGRNLMAIARVLDDQLVCGGDLNLDFFSERKQEDDRKHGLTAERDKAERSLQDSFMELMEIYYEARAKLLYQDSELEIDLQMTNDLLHLNVLLYSLRNLVKASSLRRRHTPTHDQKQREDREAKGSNDDISTSSSSFPRLCLVFGMVIHPIWNTLPHFTCKINVTKTNVKNALKVAIAMVLTSLLVLVRDFRGSFDNAFWGPLTVAFVMGRSSATSFKQSLLRMQGTVSGAIFGYTLLRLTDANRIAILIALPILVFFASLAKPSAQYGYAGVVAAFTSGIIVLGFESTTLSIEEYALARIELTGIGILVWFFVVVTIFPFRPREQLQSEVLATLKLMADWTLKLASEARNHTKGIKYPPVILAVIDTKLNGVRQLLAEAKASPSILSKTFPGAATERLFLLLVKIKSTLNALNRVAVEWGENIFLRKTTEEFDHVHRLCANALTHLSIAEPHSLPEKRREDLQLSLQNLHEKYLEVVRDILTNDEQPEFINDTKDYYCPSKIYTDDDDDDEKGGGGVKKRKGGKRNHDGKTSAAAAAASSSFCYGFRAKDWQQREQSMISSRRRCSTTTTITTDRMMMMRRISSNDSYHQNIDDDDDDHDHDDGQKVTTTTTEAAEGQKEKDPIERGATRAATEGSWKGIPKMKNKVVMVYSTYIFHLNHLVGLIINFSDAAREVQLQSYLYAEDERYH